MVCGNRRGHVVGGLPDEVDRRVRGDVLQHHAQAGKIARQRHEVPVNEYRLTVKHVHGRIGHFAVQQQRQILLFHRREH